MEPPSAAGLPADAHAQPAQDLHFPRQHLWVLAET